MNNFAHSLPDEPVENWHTLRDHLKETAKIAGEFAASFDSQKWAEVAAILHDLGKADPSFQGYLRRQNGLDDQNYDRGKVNHSSAGASFALECLTPLSGKILAYLIAGHHAGLPDWYSSDTGNAALSVRLQNDGVPNLIRLKEQSDSFVTETRQYINQIVMESNEPFCESPASQNIGLKPPPILQGAEDIHLWIRMLYSCLVDADFLDTEAFMSPDEASKRSGFASLKELKMSFDRHMSKLLATCPKTPVNQERKDILSQCREAAGTEPGIFTLTVPTGGGKTLASMAFAFDHAIHWNKRRIIYVIPYTSIIEQTAIILRQILGDDNVIEHHSNIDSDSETKRSQLASENWDAPIVITTNVQFFESLYAARSSRCRKLHNISDSVVILDEAQLIPPELLSPCVDVINQLVNNFGVSILLSTATQPALPGLKPTHEIVTDSEDLFERLKRVEYSFEPLEHRREGWDDIAEKLMEYQQVLCIVNSRRDCYDLYRLMPDDTIHLSALMCGQHRTEKIKFIREKLQKKEPIRVISTQLVEAGVDIDFPVVLRAFAGLSSIAQSAGRCNREGLQNKPGKVFVFNPPKPSPQGLLRKAEDTTKELLQSPDFNPTKPGQYTKFFDYFYNRLNDTGKEKFYDLLVRDAGELNISFRTAALNFSVIDDTSYCSVLTRYKGSPPLLERLRSIGPKRNIMRKLQRYSVNIGKQVAESLMSDGMIEEIWPGILAQTLSGLYTDEVGLDIFRGRLPPDDLIV